MFKDDILIPFLLIFIIVAVLGSVLITPEIIGILNGVDYYGFPFTFWSIDRLASPEVTKFNFLSFLLDASFWAILSFLLSKLFLKIFKKKNERKGE